jgi:hypothetical protein
LDESLSVDAFHTACSMSICAGLEGRMDVAKIGALTL